MAYSIHAAQKHLKKHLSKNWDSISFEFEAESEKLHVSASVTLKGFDDDILIVIDVYSGGMAYFRAVFDKVNPENIPDMLNYFRTINQFNAEDNYFRAYVREDQYLVLDHPTSYNDEKELPHFVEECMMRLADMDESEPLQILTAATE